MKHWFCAVTKPQQEARAAVELSKQDFHVYLPVLAKRPMFPRYIFLEFDRDLDNWGVVRSTRGCCDLLKTGFLPTIVPSKAMDAIMAFRESTEAIQAEQAFIPGQTVKITNGLLRGYEGLFRGTDKQRVKAFLEIMGNRIEVSIRDIQGAA